MLSKVMQDAPAYAFYDSAAKFQAIQGIIIRRLREHPNCICSYSGGSDSDIMLDLLERTRKIMPSLPVIDYVFYNTGLEMKAIKEHIRETERKYNLSIKEVRPKVNIVMASRKYGIPFVSKIMSQGLESWQKKEIDLSIYDEYNNAEDKEKKFQELVDRYPKSKSVITFICCCSSKGEPRPDIQLVINSSKYMLDFIRENPPKFKISAKCCDLCKKAPAHEIEINYDMSITGERRAEGGRRSVPRSGDNSALCFSKLSNGKYRFKPLYYVTDKDKEWYKKEYNIKYSDAYDIYGLTRTGCCGCPISYRAVEDLELMKPYEPLLVKAAWNVFGESYRYRKEYLDYKESRKKGE